MNGSLAAYLQEDEEGYQFQYKEEYLKTNSALAISQTLPLQKEVYTDKNLFPFFDGLIPEGWMLNIVHNNWKVNIRDRMGLLLLCCKDCIGSVSVEKIKEENND
jgi:serine/threonine-protein kinase HipA